MGTDPAVTLRERLGVAVDFADFSGRGGKRQQVLMHAKIDLTADLQAGIEQHVERAAHCAFGGIFNRHHAVMRAPRLDCAEHVVDRALRLESGRTAESLARCSLREGALRAEVGDAERLLKRQTRRNDFAKDGGERRIGQRPGVMGGDATQHLCFALGAIGVALLDFANTAGEFGALG